MTARTTSDSVWTAIEKEKRRDSLLRKVSVAAWTFTAFLLLVYGGMVATKVSRLMQLAEVGIVQRQDVFNATIPLIAVVGTVMLLVATLSTIGVFLRMRTATLSEIQLRLASLEAMLESTPDPAR
jgi:hypothetical protein